MNIRNAAVSGMFYPNDPKTLSANIERLLDAHSRNANPNVAGIVSPHAGYTYSGYTAASVYAQLDPLRYETVIILAPSHYEFFNYISIFPGDAYATPLGYIEVDKELRDEALSISPSIRLSEHGHRKEHAVEVQIPFVQTVLPKTPFLPIVIGDQTTGHIRELGRVLTHIATKKSVLIIASSDLSHFHPLEQALSLDAQMISCIKEMYPNALLQSISEGTSEACGFGVIAALLTTANSIGNAHAEIIHQSTSADTTGDPSRVVGYVSATISIPS